MNADDFVHENSGTVTPASTNHVVSLAGADQTTAGNTVIVVLNTAAAAPTAPAGFILDKQVGSFVSVYRKSEVAAGETSWTFTTGVSTASNWYVAELSGVDMVEPLDAEASNSGLVGNGGTLASGTTPLNAALNTLVLAVFEAERAGTETISWSGYTNNFEEVADLGLNAAPITGQLAVARKFVDGATGQFTTTATLATTGSAVTCYTAIVVYRAAGSPIVAPLAAMAGFEQGTHGGATATTGTGSLFGSALAPVGTWGTTYLVQAASARTSGYGLRLVRSAAAGAVRIGSFSSRVFTAGMNVRMVSGSGIVSVASGVASNGLNRAGLLLYDFTTNKFGVQYGATPVWQDGTTPLNTWVWVEWRHSPAVGAIDWRLETAADTYTDQPSATGTAGVGTTLVTLQLGNGTGSTDTATIDIDDVVVSRFYSTYPLGPHEVRLLKVDPAGTPTLSGTSTNFSVFTANGTLGAWNAANARDAVDEVPPTVSASADGVCQTAVAASDYIEFPMAAPVVAADEVVVGVRSLVPMWGGTGTGTGTVGVRGWDGVTETVLTPASTSYDAGSPTAYSTTEPRWECANWPSVNGWTVTELAAAALRFGFSTDATPDMGCDALYLEYAVRKTTSQGMFGVAEDVLVTSQTNPNTLGIRSLATDTPEGKGTSLTYQESGSPTTVVVAQDSTDSRTLDAADAPTINRVDLYPDPEGVADT